MIDVFVNILNFISQAIAWLFLICCVSYFILLFIFDEETRLYCCLGALVGFFLSDFSDKD
jgi:hypothetical protein